VWKSRKNEQLVTANIVLFSALALLTGPLNQFLRTHHQLVATRNYFDDSGAFIGLTWAVPMIGFILLTLVSLFSIIITTMKRQAQLLQEMRKRK